MAEFKTLNFSNTRVGQKKKIKALARETAQGWRIVSETISGGEFKAKKACCLFLLFAPCAFCAGNKQSTITVTLQRG